MKSMTYEKCASDGRQQIVCKSIRVARQLHSNIEETRSMTETCVDSYRNRYTVHRSIHSPMRINVNIADRVGIAQEILAKLARRALNVSAVEVEPPHVYIEAPALDAAGLDLLRSELLQVAGVLSVDELAMLPGARRRLYLDALLASQEDPVLAVDGDGVVVVANAAAVAASRLPEAQLVGTSLKQLLGDAEWVDALIGRGERLPVSEVQVGGEPFLCESVALHDPAGGIAGAVLTLHAPHRIGERLSALQNYDAGGFEAILGDSAPLRQLKAARGADGAGRCAAADPRRDRHRQGAGRACLPRGQPAPRAAVLHAELRGAAREPGRERAVRLRARRLHRRAARRQAGAAGAGRRRHRVPRRGRRDVAVPAGQAAALSERRQLPPRRRRPRAEGRRARRQRHAPLARADGGQRRVPPGPAVPPRRAAAAAAAAARSGRGHRAAGRVLPRTRVRADRATEGAAVAGGAHAPCSAIPGPATCASCRT